jgi:carboxypeptidase C (cathepsin A)
MRKKCFYFFMILSFVIEGYCGFNADQLFSQELPKKPSELDSKYSTKNTGKEVSKGGFSVTHHSIKINNVVLDYTATVGSIQIQNRAGEYEADISFFAYTKDNVEDQSQRPITFAFNGRPGASSVWLHLGAAGPKRVFITDQVTPLSPPYGLVDNEYGWLDLTDLVFIDPVGTGYSRPARGKDPKQFYDIKGDIRTVGELIRLYTTKFNRWRSPTFIAGESYGTIRAVLLVGYLHETYGMVVNGLLLISSVLNFQALALNPGNDLPYVMFLPTYTATASYHKKVSPELQTDLGKTLKEVEQWALTEYLSALSKGNTLQDPERSRIMEKLERYTGLSHDYIKNSNLRITNHAFFKGIVTPGESYDWAPGQ